jgi:uncharacterized RDD family membrane protein YckC
VHAVSGIVTPEAVVLELETAGIGSRLMARVIDTALQAAVVIVLMLASVVVGANVSHVGMAGVFVSAFVVLFVYPIAFETLWRGRTPGKAALGLRVVTVEGAPITFRHAAIRALLALVDVYLPVLFGAVGLITMLLTPRSQRLGDLVAGTIVLRERSAAGQPTAVTFTVPPGYESYAATLDVSGLRPSDYSAVRSFLLRAPSLAPAVRYELGRRLATPLLERLHHTPPPGVSPEAMLACVAGVWQARFRPPPPVAPSPVPSPVPPPVAPTASEPPPARPPSGPTGGYVPPA